MTENINFKRRTILKGASAVGIASGSVAIVQGREMDEYQIGQFNIVSHNLEYGIIDEDGQSVAQRNKYYDEILERIHPFSFSQSMNYCMLGTNTPAALPDNEDLLIYNDDFSRFKSYLKESKHVPIGGNDPKERKYTKVNQAVEFPSPSIRKESNKIVLNYENKSVEVGTGSQERIKLEGFQVRHERTGQELKLTPKITIHNLGNTTVLGDEHSWLFPLDPDDRDLRRIVNSFLEASDDVSETEIEKKDMMVVVTPQNK